MQFHPSPPSTVFLRQFPSFIQFIVIAIYVVDGIRADHVWEDFPGAEMKDILSDIEKKKLEVEKLESQAYKGEEETNYELLPLVPQSEAQKQYLPTFSENEYEDEYIIDPRMLVAIIINCLVLDLIVVAMLCRFLCKICPTIKHKFGSFKPCDKEKKLDCETSASTPSTVKKEVISVENVVFETD